MKAYIDSYKQGLVLHTYLVPKAHLVFPANMEIEFFRLVIPKLWVCDPQPTFWCVEKLTDPLG